MAGQRARVGQVYARLTARERVVAMVETRRAGREPAPRLFDAMPDEQVSEYNGYIARLNRLATESRVWLLAIAGALNTIEALGGWYTALLVVDGRLEPVRWILEAAPPGEWSSTRHRELHKAITEAVGRLGFAGASGGGMEHKDDSADLAPTLLRRIRASVQEQWQQVRLIELQVDAVTADLGCADALDPDLRGHLTLCRERLRVLAAETPYLGGPIALPEPDGDLLEQGRRAFRPDEQLAAG